MRLSSIKCLLAGIVAVFVSSALQPVCARGLDQIISSGELRVGYIVTPPNAIKDPATGNLSGFDVDAIREIAKEMGLKTTFTETDWGTFAAGLQADQFDVSIAPTFATTKRSMAVLFLRPLIFAGNGALVKAEDNRYKTSRRYEQSGHPHCGAPGRASGGFRTPQHAQGPTHITGEHRPYRGYDRGRRRPR